MISFKILGKVKAKQSVKFTKSGIKYTPHDVVEYSNYLKLCFMRMYPNFTPLECALRVDIEVFMGIPKSFSKKKYMQAIAGNIKPTVKPDCDNIAKNICDSLNGIVYKDDKQICELRVKKTYAEYDYTQVNISML